MKTSVIEETFIMLKPDVIDRGLVGRLIQKFEDANLDIKSLKTTEVSSHLASMHYKYDENRMLNLGNKAIKYFDKNNLQIKKMVGTDNPRELGYRIWRWSVDYINKRHVIVGIVSGPHAIERVRQIVGATNPLEAARGTIRGDFCTDSYIHSNIEGRAIFNLVHRLADLREANRYRFDLLLDSWVLSY